MSEQWKDAACHYVFEGKNYGFTIRATSFEEAEARLRAIRTTGKLNGWPCYSVKLPGPLAYLALPFMPIVVAILNLFGRGKRP